MSFVGSLLGGVLGSGASGNASSAEQKAAQQAIGTIKQGEGNSQNFLNNTWAGTQQNFNPYLSLGSSSANNLQGLLNQGFQAPTFQQAQNNPGYQFTLSQGTNAIDQNAAANGTLLSGNTGVALQNYGQGLASTDYQQVYNNALQGYMANLQGLMGGTQIGQGSASTLGYLGNQATGLNTAINMGAARQIAQQQNNIGAAQASGYLGSANAWGNALGGMFGGISNGIGNMSNQSSGLENLGNFALGALAMG